MNSSGVNQSIQKQLIFLHEILKKNLSLYRIIEDINKFELPSYYIGGGVIAQTVWNYLLDKPLNYGISDVDIIYYDGDLSKSKEEKIIQSLKSYFKDNEYDIDVANEARVHLWYKKNYGKEINAYTSVEEAISTWPTTATSIGVKLEGDELIVFAPYGMNDLFQLIVRPNKLMIDKDIYENKVRKWQQKWNELDYKEW